eukprot:4553466-Pleurochrysis_carterae.AAC.1
MPTMQQPTPAALRASQAATPTTARVVLMKARAQVLAQRSMPMQAAPSTSCVRHRDGSRCVSLRLPTSSAKQAR